jgi:hypothetical protein
MEKAKSQAAFISLIQLWMAAFQYFINPRLGRQNKKPTPQPILSLKERIELQKVARKLSFYFQHPSPSDSYPPIFQYMAETLIKNPKDVAKNSKALAEDFCKLYLSISGNNIPTLSTDSTELKARFRCGRPLENDYQELQDAIFYKNIYDSMRPTRLYVTPFAVLRDIFLLFLGRDFEGKQNEEQEEVGTERAEEERVEEERVEEERVEEEIVEEERVEEEIVEEEIVEEEEVDEDMDEDSISLEPHPPGTPPLPPPRDEQDGTKASYNTPPLAAGFEDATCIGPLNKRCILTVQRSAVEMIIIWLHSGNPDLMVFFAFDS